MGQLLAPLVWAAAGLLALAGVAKVMYPLASTPALRAAGLPSHKALVAAYGIVEVVVGVAALVVPSPLTLIALGLLYLAFAAIVARLAFINVEGVSCGCAGNRDLPPSYLHAALNLVAAAAAALSALDPRPLYDAAVAIGAEAVPML